MLTCRLMAHGRTPCVAISMICRRTWIGSGRPLMKTPPNWLTRPWPARDQEVRCSLSCIVSLPISASCSAWWNMSSGRYPRNKEWVDLTLLICECSIESLPRFDDERKLRLMMIRRCNRTFIEIRGVNEVDKSTGERKTWTDCCANWLTERVCCW